MQQQFPFSKHLFWDTEVTPNFLVGADRLVIERVLSRGTIQEFFKLLEIYSEEKIIEVAKTSRNINRRAGNFIADLYSIPKEEICILKPSPHLLFPN